MKLKFKRATYHRNGVSGEGFYVVEFLSKQERSWSDMRGIVFDTKGHCAVIDHKSPSDRFRGDHFEPELRNFIANEELSAVAA